MNPRNLYGIVALLVAALVLSSTATLYFYYEYNQAAQSNTILTNELQGASQKYNSTASEFNRLRSSYSQLLANFGALSAGFNGSTTSFKQIASIYNQSVAQFNLLSRSFLTLSSQYNVTVSLLSAAVSQLNTSEPAYANASKMLTGLWKQYTSLVAGYKDIVQNYNQIFTQFSAALTSFSEKTNITLSASNYPQPVKPISVSLLTSNILFDFGNGTRIWFNNTAIQPSWNLYLATLIVTSGNVQATWYPQYSEHFITGVFGVKDTLSKSWFVWSYNQTSSTWVSPLSGADQLMMYNGSVYAWTFCGFNSTTYAPTCTPP